MEVPRRFQGLMETLTYQGTPKDTKGSKKHRSWRGWPVTLPQASSIRRPPDKPPWQGDVAC